jgi:Ca2+-binding EF-hand superfamily protein
MGDEVRVKKPCVEVRQEIREYIRNERDTIMKKWMALKENIASEDRRREEFFRKKEMEDTKSLPVNILKFIGTMKKAVRTTMRYKGGTPYSIIRSMFIYWDADKSGLISVDELFACMHSLGARVTKGECEEIVQFYRVPGETEMDYRELLQDVLSGEPSLLAFVTVEEDEAKTNNEIRFEEFTDRFVHMPPIVKKFLEAVRNYLQNKMRVDGGTPFQHIRYLFQFYDYDYSNGLDYKELILACRRSMKMSITEAQAKQIVDFYDRKDSGQINYERFLNDVCGDVQPILHFTELTPRRIEQSKKSLSVNPFIPKAFAAPPNRVLEQFKADVKQALTHKVNKIGGSVASWIREAFVNWDRNYSGKISDWTHLQGAAQRLGVHLSEEDARALIACYDRFNTGEMHYHYFTEEIMKEDWHFMAGPSAKETSRTEGTGGRSTTMNASVSATMRTPSSVQACLRKIRKACDNFTKKSKGALQGRDVLHGTFVRFDPAKCGRVSEETFICVLDELRVSVDTASIQETLKWFDTDGTSQVDYNSLTRQIFGADVTTERLVLPKLKEATSYTKLLQTTKSSNLLSSSASAASLNYLSVSKSSELLGPSEFGVRSNVMEKNLDNIESQAVKLARTKQKRQKILQEKVKIERKLATIEEQRKKVIEDYKLHKAQKAGAV